MVVVVVVAAAAGASGLVALCAGAPPFPAFGCASIGGERTASMSVETKRAVLSERRRWSRPTRWSGGMRRLRRVAAVPTQLKMHTSS